MLHLNQSKARRTPQPTVSPSPIHPQFPISTRSTAQPHNRNNHRITPITTLSPYNHLLRNPYAKKRNLYATIVRFLIFTTAGRRAKPTCKPGYLTLGYLTLPPTLMQVRIDIFIARNFKFSGSRGCPPQSATYLTLGSGKEFRERGIHHAQVLIPVSKIRSNIIGSQDFRDGDTRPLDIYLIM